MKTNILSIVYTIDIKSGKWLVIRVSFSPKTGSTLQIGYMNAMSASQKL
jgi:hypothetical protein